MSCIKRVFPILIAGDEASAVPIGLITVQFVDGRGNLREALSQDLLPALLPQGYHPSAKDENLKEAAAGTAEALPN